MEFTPQTGIFLVIGCLVLLTVFFMVVAGAALFVARLSGHSLLGPVLGTALKMLSVKSDADSSDDNDSAPILQQHRHINAAEVKAQSAQSLDFERTVEQYRGQGAYPPAQQGGGYVAEAQAIGTPLPPQSFTPSMPPVPIASSVPITPIAPPIVSTPEPMPQSPLAPTPEAAVPLDTDVPQWHSTVPPQYPTTPPLETDILPLPSIRPPLPETPAPLGAQIPSEDEYTARPPRPPSLPDEDENLPPPLVRPSGNPR